MSDHNKLLGLHDIKNTASRPLIPQIKEMFSNVYKNDWVFVGWERWFILGCFAFTVYTAIKFVIKLF